MDIVWATYEFTEMKNMFCLESEIRFYVGWLKIQFLQDLVSNFFKKTIVLVVVDSLFLFHCFMHLGGVLLG